MSLLIKNANLLDATEDFICHQCNCVTTTPYGLSAQIFQKFPYANTYAQRISNPSSRNFARLDTQSVPGTIDVTGKVINIYAQYGPGKPNSFNDTYEQRKTWFKNCLNHIATLKPKSLAFPYNIGCGLAGGVWSEYEAMLTVFARENSETQLVLYKI